MNNKWIDYNCEHKKLNLNLKMLVANIEVVAKKAISSLFIVT